MGEVIQGFMELRLDELDREVRVAEQVRIRQGYDPNEAVFDLREDQDSNPTGEEAVIIPFRRRDHRSDITSQSHPDDSTPPPKGA